MPTAQDIANAQIANAAGQIAAQGTSKALANDIVKALYDVLGAYPRANVLPYYYQMSRTNAKANAVGALATVQDSIKVSADAAFIAVKVVGASTNDYAIQVRLAGSDRILMNEPVHSAAFVGTAERPSILPKPLLIQPNSTVALDITDLSGAPNEVYFNLAGFKVYNLQQYGAV